MMAKAEIGAGICGFTTTVEAQANGDVVDLTIQSECKGIQRLAEQLKQVDPLREITYRGEGPLVLATAAQACKHPACPVPSGIVKVIEVAAGLALPADVTIKLDK
jgi:Family of unknown function (DUF6951)